MTDFFLDRIAIIDLASSTVAYHSLPSAEKKLDDPSLLAKNLDDAMILSAGRLTGSYAPAACVVNVQCGGKSCFLKAHCGVALRQCGLDALVLHGAAATPSCCILDEHGLQILEMDAESEGPVQRHAMRAAAKKFGKGDSDPVTITTGPAAFAGCVAPALILDEGIAPRSNSAALWMAAHNVTGIALNGTLSFSSPLPLDNPLRASVSPALLTPTGLGSVLRQACVTDISIPNNLPQVRSIACFACPAPCQCWLPASQKFAACTSPEALALFLEKGASITRAAELFLLAERFGLEPLGLTALTSEPTLPRDARTASPLVDDVGNVPDSEQDALAALVGICPFFLRRFPELHKALEPYAK